MSLDNAMHQLEAQSPCLELKFILKAVIILEY